MPREIEPLEGTRWTTTRPQTTHNAPFAGLSGTRWTTTRPQTTHNAPFAGLGYWSPAFAGLGAYKTQPQMEALRDAYFDWTTAVFDKFDRPAAGTRAREIWDRINAILIGAGDWADSEGMKPGAPGYDLWAARFDEAQVLFARIKGLLLPAPEPTEPTGPVIRGEDIAVTGRVGPWAVAIGVAGLALALAARRLR